MPQLVTKGSGTQDNMTQSDIYLWIVIIGILIGIGLVLLGSWVLRTKLSQMLGILLHLITRLAGSQPQQERSRHIYQYYYKNTAPLILPYIPEVELIWTDPERQSYR